MAINNFDLGIRSVTFTRNSDGELVEQDCVEWSINDYHVNQQAEESEPAMEPFAGSAPKRKTRKRKTVADDKPSGTKSRPKMVGQDLVEKAHKSDLRRRGLN